MLGRAFDRTVLANVHRLGMWHEKFSWSQWQKVKQCYDLREACGTSLIMNPVSEGKLLKSSQSMELKDNSNCFMSREIPSATCGRVGPAKIERVHENRESFTISDGPVVSIGQSAEINGEMFSVIELDLNDGLQTVFIDKKLPPRSQLVRFGGIGPHNLVMGTGTFTVATCPYHEWANNTYNGICCSIENKGTAFNLSILMGVAVDNPNHAMVIKD